VNKKKWIDEYELCDSLAVIVAVLEHMSDKYILESLIYNRLFLWRLRARAPLSLPVHLSVTRMVLKTIHL